MIKKYEPLDTRDFFPFEDYKELNLGNTKEACERFYNAPARSCDILASDRAPSCSKLNGMLIAHLGLQKCFLNIHLLVLSLCQYSDPSSPD